MSQENLKKTEQGMPGGEQPAAEGSQRNRGKAGGVGLEGGLHHCPLDCTQPTESLEVFEQGEAVPQPGAKLSRAGGAAAVPQVQRRPRLPKPAGEILAESAPHFAWLQAVLLVSLLMSINHRHTNKHARRFHTAASLMEQSTRA